MSQDRWSIEKYKWDLLRFAFPLRDQEFGLLDMLPMLSLLEKTNHLFAIRKINAPEAQYPATLRDQIQGKLFSPRDPKY
jgi:hypothetical protein